MVDNNTPHFQINVLHSIDMTDDDNVDVVISLDNGEKYHGTFFTLKNVQNLMNRWKSTGESPRDIACFWASNAVIVEELSLSTMESVVEFYLKNGDFYHVFLNISPQKKNVEECLE